MLKTFLSIILYIPGALAQCERIWTIHFEQLAHSETKPMDAMINYRFTVTDTIRSKIPDNNFFSEESKSYSHTQKVDLPKLRSYFDATQLGIKYDVIYCNEATEEKIDMIFFDKKDIVPYGAIDYFLYGRFDTESLGTFRFEESKTFCRPATADAQVRLVSFAITKEPEHPKFPTVVRLDFEIIGDFKRRPDVFKSCNLEKDRKKEAYHKEIWDIVNREWEAKQLAVKLLI